LLIDADSIKAGLLFFFLRHTAQISRYS